MSPATAACSLKAPKIVASATLRPVAASPSAPRRLPALAARILELMDGTRTVEEVCDALQISVNKGVATVKKLAALGLLEEDPLPGRIRTSVSQLEAMRAARASAEPATFSPEEEAFFATEPEAIDLCDEPYQPLGERVSLWLSEVVLRLKTTPAL